MASDMKILFVFNFETGDASCSWWQEIAVVYGSNEDIKTIEDGFCSYFESTALFYHWQLSYILTLIIRQ